MRCRPQFELLEDRQFLSVNPVLLRDIGINVSDTEIDENGSQIAEFYEFNGEVYFRADNGIVGSELYKTDGTPAGTVLVKDITQNTVFLNESITASSTPRGFYEANGLLYFFADVARQGEMRTELWRTDGSEVGTIMLADVNLPPNWSPDLMGALGDKLYFGVFDSAVDGTHNDLWQTDGTPEGTTIVHEFPAGTVDRPYGLNLWLSYEFRGELFFSASDPEHGLELWRTDGTSEGTQLVLDANPGPDDSFPLSPVEVDGEMFFIADVWNTETSRVGSHVYKTDGTSAGTQRVSDALVDWQAGLFASGGLVYFTGYTVEEGFEPYRTDGTSMGTVQLATTWEGEHDLFEGLVDGFFAGLDRVFFTSANVEQANDLFYSTLWSTQGTPESTVQLSENIVPVGEELGFVEHEGVGYFSTAGSRIADDESQDDRLGRTDGTPAGTSVIDGPLPDWRNVSTKLIFDDKLILVGRVDGVVGQELWEFDPVDATFTVIDIAPGPVSAISRNHSIDPFRYKDMLLVYAAGSVQQGDELWSLQLEQPTLVAGDIDGNGLVEFADFLVLAANFGKEGTRADGDLDGNLKIDFADFLIMAANFGT